MDSILFAALQLQDVEKAADILWWKGSYNLEVFDKEIDLAVDAEELPCTLEHMQLVRDCLEEIVDEQIREDAEDLERQHEEFEVVKAAKANASANPDPTPQ